MKQEYRIFPSTQKRLALTFCLQQALAILQMPQLELSQWIQEEIDKNPLLEEMETPKKRFLEVEVEAPYSLEEYLQKQIRDNFPSIDQQITANKLLEYLDEKGFLTLSIDAIAEELHLDPSYLESIIAILQTFDPPGIFARNLQESLLIQLKHRGEQDSPSYLVVKNYYGDLIQGRFSFIRKKIGIIDLAEVVHNLSLLQLRPLDTLKQEHNSTVIPDIIFTCTDQKWIIGMNEETLPKFRINLKYEELNPSNPEEQETMRAWLNQGKALLRSLSRRKTILLKIGSLLAKHQSDYLINKGGLKRLTPKDLANKLDLHESTISRSLSNKYAETPRGIIPLKSLLSAAPKTGKAKETLQEIIAKENKFSPLSDEELSEELQKMGHKVSRRTISKYRKELKIPSALIRKNYV